MIDAQRKQVYIQASSNREFESAKKMSRKRKNPPVAKEELLSPMQQKATQSVVEYEFENQKQAFENISPEELAPYHGQFVAAIDGKIVDSDKDMMELDQGILDRYGDVPVYITKVGERAIFNIPTPFVR